MNKKIYLIAVIITVQGIAFTACKQGTESEQGSGKALSQEEMVKRGSYLVNAMGCDDCHSPKRIGPNGPELVPELRLSGYTSSKPVQKANTSVISESWTLMNDDFTSTLGVWGQSFAANLTSDGTGIGNWKEEQFIKAIREGKYKGLDNTRPLLPPMPWFAYKNLSDEDLKSIFAYLKTIKPVQNVVPAPIELSKL